MGGTELLIALVKVAAVLVLLIGALKLLGRYQRGGGSGRSGGRAIKARTSVLEIVDQTPVAQVTYAPDHPMFGGAEASLGECNPGA